MATSSPATVMRPELGVSRKLMQPQDGGLARARAADDRDHPAALESQRDAVEDGPVAVTEPDVIEGEEILGQGGAGYAGRNPAF